MCVLLFFKLNLKEISSEFCLFIIFINCTCFVKCFDFIKLKKKIAWYSKYGQKHTCRVIIFSAISFVLISLLT